MKVKKPRSVNRLNRPTEEIFEELREWRLYISRLFELPAYTIFSDADLYEIAACDAVCKDDLLLANGMGPKKYEQFGDAVFQIISHYIDSEHETEAAHEEDTAITKNRDGIEKSYEEAVDEYEPVSDNTHNRPTINPEKDLPYKREDPECAEIKHPSCNDCLHRAGERCSQLRDNPCKDFRAIPYVSEEEKQAWREARLSYGGSSNSSGYESYWGFDEIGLG